MKSLGPFDKTRKFQIPGYNGYVPTIKSENLHGSTFSDITRKIYNSPDSNTKEPYGR